MAILEMIDGTTLGVSYNQAVKVDQLIRKKAMPNNEKQRLFMEKVKRVIFDQDIHERFKARLDKFARDHNIDLSKLPDDNWQEPVRLGVFNLPMEETRLPYKD